MNFTIISLFSTLLISVIRTSAQSSFQSFDGNGDADAVSSFHGSLAIVVGVMSVMLALAVCALLYAKSSGAAEPQGTDRAPAARSGSGMSGIDRTVIESLPFFRFASLKGSRDGLDCAVCLSGFEGSDILRLLPKCKHAFHTDCVDQWLVKHSSCPLCRNKIDPEDVSIFSYSDSMRILRDDQDRQGSSRFSIGGSFRRIRAILTVDQEPEKEEDDHRPSIPPRKSNVLSDVVFKHRWSNVSSSDIMLLSSEIGGDVTPDHLPQTTSSDDQRKARRSMSDISGISRYRDVGSESIISIGDSCVKEARMRNLWLRIAKKTVLWFARREERVVNKNSTDSLTFGV